MMPLLFVGAQVDLAALLVHGKFGVDDDRQSVPRRAGERVGPEDRRGVAAGRLDPQPLAFQAGGTHGADDLLAVHPRQQDRALHGGVALPLARDVHPVDAPALHLFQRRDTCLAPRPFSPMPNRDGVEAGGEGEDIGQELLESPQSGFRRIMLSLIPPSIFREAGVMPDAVAEPRPPPSTQGRLRGFGPIERLHAGVDVGADGFERLTRTIQRKSELPLLAAALDEPFDPDLVREDVADEEPRTELSGVPGGLERLG